MDPAGELRSGDGDGGGAEEEETVARKRARRVSFAETTAVHVFDRDDDSDTPPASSTAAAAAASDGGGGEESVLPAREEREEEEDDDDEEEQERFVQDMAVESSSPGSAVGSVTSNDDDNFFGPVSTSFIKSGRFSDSGISEDNNHDITLDSTAFSLHFREIAPPDDRSANSAGSLRTPMGDFVTADSGNFMDPTGFKKPIPRNKLSNDKTSSRTGNSNSMSLVVENPRKYDYGKFSPTMEALLAQVNESMRESPKAGIGHVAGDHVNEDAEGGGKEEKHIDISTVPPNYGSNEGFPDSHLSNGSATDIRTYQAIADPLPHMEAGRHADALNNFRAKGMTSPMIKESFKSFHEANVSNSLAVHAETSDMLLQSDHDQLDFFRDQTSGNKYSKASPESLLKVSEAVQADGQQKLTGPDHGMQTPKNTIQPFQPPLQESVSSLRAKRQCLFSDSSVPYGSKFTRTSAIEQPRSSYQIELTKHGERISAIKNSISKFKIPESPIGTIPRSTLSGKDHMAFDVSNADLVDTSAVAIKEDLVNVGKRTTEQEISAEISYSGLETPKNIPISRLSKENGVADETIRLPKSISPFQLSNLEITMRNPLTPINTTKIAFVANAHGSSQRKDTPEVRKNSQLAVDNSLRNISSLLQMPEHNSSIPQEGSFSSNVDDTVKSSSLHEGNTLQPGILLSASNCNKVEKVQSPKEMVENDTTINNLQNGTEICEPVCFKDQDENVGRHVQWNAEANSPGVLAPIKHWTEILAKTSEITKQSFPPSIGNLNLQQLDILEDMLGELQNFTKYERLCTEICYLKNHDSLGHMHQKRLAEAKLLQNRLAFEKAKWQLKSAKLDSLRKTAHQFQSGIQECQKLKSSLMQACVRGSGAAQNINQHLPSVKSFSSSENQEDRSRVASMGHELEMLDQKLRRLMKSFEISCKISGSMSCDGFVQAVNEHLGLRTRCRAIHQYLQLWELSDMVNKGDQWEIVLSYLNLLSQRLMICPASSIAVTTMLDDANIRKNFPNMNACTAFEFIFKTKDEKRLASSKYLQQETLVTSFLLGTLLDVLEEVQAARVGIAQLICSTFLSQSSSQLELQLCFLSLKSGQKLTLDLDMADLNCAVYPGEPSELKIRICGAQTTLASSILGEIMGAVRRLQGGRPVIVRLCQSISQLVEASSH